MKRILIRKFKPSDIRDVSLLVYEIFNERYNETIYLNAYYRWSNGFIIAEDNKKIIGVLLGILINLFHSRILILGVKPSYQSMGIGSNLIYKFMEISKLLGVKKVTLEVRCSNVRGIKFYKRHNFNVIGKVKKYYKDGEDAYLMQKKIT